MLGKRSFHTMFKFLKEKLKSWVSKSQKKVEEKVEESIEKEAKEQIKESKEKKKEVKKKIEKKKKEKKKIEKKEQKTEEKVEKSKKEDIEEVEEEIKEIEKEKQDIEEVEEEIKEQEEKVEEVEQEIQEEKKPSFFQRLKKTFSYKISESDFNEIFDDLELLLLENNVALEVVETIKENLQKELLNKEVKKQDIEKEIKLALKKSLQEIIIEPDNILDTIKEIKRQGKGPFKILFFGINGAGKTTAIAKLTHLLKKNKFSVVLAAADTFRAASIEQLQIHADKLGVKMIKHDYGSDPSAVAFDAIKHAETNKIDVVLVDTAGRMHTKDDLLREMEKIVRVSDPDLKIFVAEAIAGNDATEQARAFNNAIEIDGSILSKTDIDEKGGTIISISHVTSKPILYLGVGQNYEDLELFDKKKFIDQLGLEE